MGAGERWSAVASPRRLSEERTMDVSRRDVLAGSVFAFGASALVLGSGAARADAGDEAAVIGRIDILRKATQEADKAKLEQVTSAQLSYGHAGGRVETKEHFINGVMTRKAVVKSLAFPEQIGRA